LLEQHPTFEDPYTMNHNKNNKEVLEKIDAKEKRLYKVKLTVVTRVKETCDTMQASHPKNQW
jgi:hypothetical protein